MILGAHAALWLVERGRAREWKRVVPAAALVLGFGLWTQWLPAGLRTDDSNGLMQLGSAYLSRGEVEDAESTLQEAVQANPRNAVARVVLAAVLDRQGRTRQALPLLEEAWARDPRLIDALKLLMNFQVRLQRYGDAERLASRVIPRGGVVESIARYHLGWIAASHEDFERALTEFQQARRLDPRSFDAAYMEGSMLRQLGRRDEALPALENALRLRRAGQAEFVEQAYQWVIELLMQAGERAAARRYAAEYAANAPGGPRAQELLRNVEGGG
jgi:tetratricopeptide (TPR) repeat protein